MNGVASDPKNIQNGPKPKSIARLFVERTAMRTRYTFTHRLMAEPEKLADKIAVNYGQAAEKRLKDIYKAYDLLFKGSLYSIRSGTVNSQLVDSAYKLGPEFLNADQLYHAEFAFEFVEKHSTSTEQVKGAQKALVVVYDKSFDQGTSIESKEEYVKKANLLDTSGVAVRIKKLATAYEQEGDKWLSYNTNGVVTDSCIDQAIANFKKADALDSDGKTNRNQKLAIVYENNGNRWLSYNTNGIVTDSCIDEAVRNFSRANVFDNEGKAQRKQKLVATYESNGTQWLSYNTNGIVTDSCIDEAKRNFGMANVLDNEGKARRNQKLAVVYESNGNQWLTYSSNGFVSQSCIDEAMRNFGGAGQYDNSREGRIRRFNNLADAHESNATKWGDSQYAASDRREAAKYRRIAEQIGESALVA